MKMRHLKCMLWNARSLLSASLGASFLECTPSLKHAPSLEHSSSVKSTLCLSNARSVFQMRLPSSSCTLSLECTLCAPSFWTQILLWLPLFSTLPLWNGYPPSATLPSQIRSCAKRASWCTHCLQNRNVSLLILEVVSPVRRGPRSANVPSSLHQMC